MISPIAVGEKAPLFELQNQSGEIVKLKDFKGKHNVLLYFYPKAMTPGCTVQACGLRDEKKSLAKLETIALGVSADSVARLLKFQERDGLNFDLLSDEDHAVTMSYGVWGQKKFMGKTYDGIHRLTFIIDKKGVVRHVIKDVKTKTHHDDVLKILTQLDL